jgi:predicted aspartyl protease
MTLPVMVNGQGPFGFVVDTGAERTVISHELAARLGLARTGSARVIGIAEAVITDLYAANGIRLRDLSLGDRIVPGFAQGNIGGPGLIGIDSLANHKLVIDFVAGRMDIRESPVSRRPRREEEFDRDTIVVTARRSAGRLILSDARINGQRVDVVLDTGAQTSVGNLALQRMVARESASGGGRGESELTSVTGASLAVRTGQIRAISVGGVDFTNLPVAYADSPAFQALGLARRPAILLGMDALRLFDRVSIDFTNRRVTFDMPDQAQREPTGRLASSSPMEGRM